MAHSGLKAMAFAFAKGGAIEEILAIYWQWLEKQKSLLSIK
jgi:hypothetical protein